MLRYFNVWLGIGWLLVVLVCYFSLTSNPPDFNIKFQYIDKVGHFASYFVLMAWFAQLYKAFNTRLFYVLFFIVMGIMLEVLQGLGGARFFEYSDMVANTLGVVLAWFITKGQLKHALLLFENIVLR
jgi:VanZ family protein